MNLKERMEETRKVAYELAEKSVNDAERNAVIKALNNSGIGGTDEAAKELEITQSEVKALIKKHKLSPFWRQNND